MTNDVIMFSIYAYIHIIINIHNINKNIHKFNNFFVLSVDACWFHMFAFVNNIAVTTGI